MAFGGFNATGISLGAVGTPSVSFTGDADTGVYSPAANIVALAAGGVDVVRASTVATAVNFLSVVAATTTAARGVALIAEGSDANVTMTLEGKGTGVVQITDLAFGNVMLIQVYS